MQYSVVGHEEVIFKAEDLIVHFPTLVVRKVYSQGAVMKRVKLDFDLYSGNILFSI